MKNLFYLLYVKFVAALIYPNTFIGRKDNLNLVFCLVEVGIITMIWDSDINKVEINLA
jgi:hypothetical protein